MADPSVLETLDPRVSELEIRLSFLEQTLAELDGVVRQVADEMVRVRESLKELEGKVQATDAPTSGKDALLYEKPPHY